jgi:dihydroxyacetone kinase
MEIAGKHSLLVRKVWVKLVLQIRSRLPDFFSHAAIFAYLNDQDISRMSSHELVQRVGDILEDNMGGTIGARKFRSLPPALFTRCFAVFAIFFTALSAALRDIDQPSTSLQWGQALDAALTALGKHTPAKPGDRTLVDALAPFCAALLNGHTLEQAVEAAREGAERTKSMQAVLGRAAYLSPPRGDGILPPDPGAWGVLAIVEGLYSGLSSRV